MMARNHVHLIVEAQGKQALGRGMKAVASRFAHCVKRVYGVPGPRARWRRVIRT